MLICHRNDEPQYAVPGSSPLVGENDLDNKGYIMSGDNFPENNYPFLRRDPQNILGEGAPPILEERAPPLPEERPPPREERPPPREERPPPREERPPPSGERAPATLEEIREKAAPGVIVRTETTKAGGRVRPRDRQSEYT